MSRLISAAATILLLLGLLAIPAAAQEPPDYVVADPTFEAREGATAYSGTLTVDGADSGYQIEVPDDWNGTLVLYAHGFVGPQQADLIVQPPPLRDLFIAQGFAWAASSYSANGYVIDSSIEETDALRTRFAELTGEDEPTATIVHGFSMGGHITGAAIERRPDAYVGALPACGVMGDLALFDYFADVNLVGDTLAGVEVPIPGDLSYLQGPAQQISAILGLQTGLRTPGGVQYADVVEHLSGGERPTFEESLRFWNVDAAIDPGEGPTIPFLRALYGRALSGGLETPVGAGDAYDNADTVYQFPNHPEGELSPVEEALNALVPRVEGDAPAPFAVIDGEPEIPVLSLHTTGDLFVPLLNQRIYAQEVADHGLSENLVQRTVRAAGHCDFTPEELVTAFGDLVTWITTGERPEGEDLLDDAVVADRDLGCAWTSETRPGMPECDPPTAITVEGADPVATSIAVSQGWEASPAAVIARADDFADGLTGASLAGGLGAPLLLNPVEALSPDVMAELRRLGVTDVTLLGGTAALSDGVEPGLADAGMTVARVAGTNRFGTAAAIATALAEAAGAPPAEVFLANGGGFADSVAVAALSAFSLQPILLVEQDRVPAETTAALAALGDPATAAVGGTDVISDQIAPDVRLAGDNRYGTSAAVVEASRGAGLRVNEPWLVDGETFVEALVAGPAAAAAGQVMAMVDGDDLAGSAGSTNDLIASLAGLVEDLVVVETADSVAQSSVDALLVSLTDG